jgi:hypothetical protein
MTCDKRNALKNDRHSRKTGTGAQGRGQPGAAPCEAATGAEIASAPVDRRRPGNWTRARVIAEFRRLRRDRHDLGD